MLPPSLWGMARPYISVTMAEPSGQLNVTNPKNGPRPLSYETLPSMSQSTGCPARVAVPTRWFQP